MKLPVTRTPIQARYSDTDAMGHFSSGSYITFMEVGRLDFFRKIVEQTGADPCTVVANITIDILQESHYGEELEVTSWCSRIGTRSLTVCNEIYANGRLVAKGSAINVGFDAITRRSSPLPQGWEVSEVPETR
ncbi:MAG TPA: thioesterase family protein [Halioglobus sp.]